MVSIPVANVFCPLDDDLLPLDEVSSSVDALVADDDGPDEPRLPFLPDGGRTSVPPGLGFNHSHPPVQLSERSSTPVPHGPVSQGTVPKSTAVPRPVTPLIPKAVARATSSAKKEADPTGGAEAKKSIKELAAKSGLSKDIAAQASKSKGKGVLQEEDFPALDSVKTGSPPKVTPALPSKSQPSSKATQTKKITSDTAGKAPPGKATTIKLDKRPVPAILDIAAATKTVSQTSVAEASNGIDKLSGQVPTSANQAQKPQGGSTFPTPTTTSASVSSPMTKAAPKTLRLVNTPKTEVSPMNIPPSVVASIRAAGITGSSHRPATPASEAISDTASIISASVSMSRTSSPPPSKVGSASVRATTKSQQRKQRKEASKEAAAQISETKPVEQEVEIAPILGRKKKQKKEKKTATASRPETPSLPEPQSDASVVQKGVPTTAFVDTSERISKGSKGSISVAESPKNGEQKNKAARSPPKNHAVVDTSIKLNESTKTTVLTPDYVGHTPEPKLEQPMDEDIGDIPNLRDVFRAVMESGSLSNAEAISFFKASTQSYRSDWPNGIPGSLPPTLKAIVTKEDEDKLNAFQPVRKIVNEHTVLLTPNGDCLLNLTEDEADLFLMLQDRLRADSVRPTAFAAPRHTPATGFSLVKNRAVPNGTPSYFPSGPDNYPSDPVGKMHREEAISCINQHVLPSLNLGGYKTAGSSSSSGRNVNLQQLAPWICPSVENAEDQRKMFSGRPGDDFGNTSASADSVYNSCHEHANGVPVPSIGSAPLMSVDDAEVAWAQSRKQHEALDKKFRQLQAKNRRLVGLH